MKQKNKKNKYIFYRSVNVHQNIRYSNRNTGQNSCFIYGRRDSSRWLFTRYPCEYIRSAYQWLLTAEDGVSEYSYF